MHRRWILVVMAAGALIIVSRAAAQDDRPGDARISTAIARPAVALTTDMAERSGGTPVAFRPGAVAQRSEFDRNRSPSELVAKRVFGGPPRLLPDQFPISHLVRRTMIISGMLMLATVTSLWLGYRRRSRGSSSDHERTLVQVLHTLTVAPRCCLHLVQVEEQRFLVARDATGWKSVTPVQTFAAQLEAEEQNLGDSAAGQPLELPPDRSFLRSERWQEYKWIR